LEAAPNSAQRQEAIDNSLHVVCEGDSFWSIAQACYGDGQFFRALYEHNRDQVTDFDRLKAGQCIKTPPSEKLQKDYPELCPYEVNHQIRLVSGFEQIQESANENEATHSTSAGDTLFEIAKQRLGQASRYLEILDLNADTLPLNVDHQTPLPGGLQLKLP
jgi:nucleoid-associated protein YgaU